MKVWVMIFSAALFAGGTCLGVALHPKLAPKPPETKPAGDRDFGPPGREFSVTRFATELGLSEEQDAELDRILGETQRDVDAYGRAMRSAHEHSRERVLEILTPEQKTKLDGLMEAERKRRRDAEHKRAVDGYTKVLGLSAEQSKALSDAMTDARSKRHDLKRWDRSAWREIRDAQNAKLKTVFTPEQFERYVDIQALTER
jgi:Spy/CpxP family protein refolding chaperone